MNPLSDGNDHFNARGRNEEEDLIGEHGGYQHLKTFRLATLIYDVTVRFCETYLDPRSRTVDQMVQAARSGRQNIAEGSMDSATSKKIEMKLTGVARGSLVELRLDYQDYLRQRGLPEWGPEHPALKRFKALRCSNLEEFRRWAADEVRRAKSGTDEPKPSDREKHTDTHRPTRSGEAGTTNTGAASDPTIRRAGARPQPPRLDRGPAPQPSARNVRVGPCVSVFVANGALSLLNLCIYLLKQQLKAQSEAFEQDGGFTERMYRRRKEFRRHQED